MTLPALGPRRGTRPTLGDACAIASLGKAKKEKCVGPVTRTPNGPLCARHAAELERIAREGVRPTRPRYAAPKVDL